MNIRVCVPLAAEKTSELIPLIERAENTGAKLIEIRLDYLKEMDGIEAIVRSSSLPLIATNRQYEQGGYRPQDEELRIRTLIKAAEGGFQYVDVELTTANLESLISKLRGLGVKPIVSFHDFEGTPTFSEMEHTLHKEIEAGGEICKLVTTAKNFNDNLTCLLLVSKMSEKSKIVCFAMGEKGIISRTLSPFFGAYFTYASLKKSMKTAPGQLTLSDLRRLYRILGVEV